MVKKKSFLLIGVLFFFNVNFCYAEEFYFNMSKDKEGILFNALCSGESGGSCHYYCKGDKTKYTGTANDAVITCGGRGEGEWYESISKFSNVNLNTIEDVSKLLNSYTNCRDSKDSKNNNCRNYVINNYCGNSNKEEVCKKLKEIKDGGIDQTVDNSGNVTSITCPITIKSGTSLKNNTLHNLNVMAYISKTEFNLYKGNSDEVYGYNVYSDEIANSDTVVHFYPKGSSYKEFSSAVSEKTFSTEKPKCPTLNFCLEDLESSKTNNVYTWWTELGECDSSKYSDVSQSSSSDGSNSGSKLAESKTNWGSMLFRNKNLLTISSCKELLGGDSSNDLIDLLKNIITIIKIIVPVILISLGTLDFAKAVFSNEDEMKKSQKKFTNRIIIAVIIFLIPTILKALLTLANSVWGNISTDFCGIL